MREHILTEKRLHPYAQPQDYIKLIFQSEFGPGHLIADRSFSHNRLADEWAEVKHLPGEASQDIGGGYIRLCIKGTDRGRLDKINRAFVASANEKSGSEEGFMKKLDIFLQMAEEGLFVFSYRQAKAAAEEYLANGIKPTSHTEIYHRHYRPAYRVVKKDYL